MSISEGILYLKDNIQLKKYKQNIRISNIFYRIKSHIQADIIMQLPLYSIRSVSIASDALNTRKKILPETVPLQILLNIFRIILNQIIIVICSLLKNTIYIFIPASCQQV